MTGPQWVSNDAGIDAILCLTLGDDAVVGVEWGVRTLEVLPRKNFEMLYAKS